MKERDVGTKGVARMERALRRIRALARVSLVIGALAGVACAAAVGVLAMGLTDYVVRAPSWLRMAAWVLGVAGVIALVRRTLVPAVRFNPRITEVALRLERLGARAQSGSVSGVAAALDLSREGSLAPAGAWMAERSIEAGTRAFGSLPNWRAIEWRPALRRVGLMLIPVGGMALAWLGSPALAEIGARRVLTPWSGAAWPKRTGVADATASGVHPLGREIEFRAVVTRTDREPGQTRVAARYRLIAGEQAGPTERVLLTGQARRIEDAEPERGLSGELFSRLVDPAVGGAGDGLEVEYWFETQDDRTPPARIRLVEPPEVARLTARVEVPAYARGLDEAAFVRGPIEMGRGDDERSLVGPVLAGSRVELVVEFNKPVVSPSADEWSAMISGGAGSGVEAAFAGDRWTIAFAAGEATRMALRARDEHGIETDSERVAAFEVVRDREPTAAVVEPSEDEFVLATARVVLAGEARDDLGLTGVWLESRRARPPAGSMGAPAEGVGEATNLARAEGSGASTGRVEHALDLGTLALSPGDEVWVHALAADAFDAGVREPTRSARRRLRIIGVEQFVEQIQGELALVRQAAIKGDETQERIEAGAIDGVGEEERREQAGLTERLAAQARVLDRLARRAERNDLDDRVLREMLEDARSGMTRASASSDQAARAMEPPGDESREREAGEARARVRDELAGVIEMLDRGQDNWTIRREVERLLGEQRALREETERAGEELAGRERGELTPEQGETLDDLARRQEELADRAAETARRLRERSEMVREEDAIRSAGLAQAAQRAERERVEERMREASERARENQASNAASEQAQAERSLEEMIEDLDSQSSNRDAALRRMAQSLIQSLESLVREQEERLRDLSSALAAMEAGGAAAAGLDRGMVRLHQNTLGLLLTARSGLREVEGVAALVESGAGAQERAIVSLRGADFEGAERGETESLGRLRRALEEARRIEEEAAERENDRVRDELRRAYRDVLERQVALREDTRGYVGAELDRRGRREVARLGERERSIRESLAEVLNETSELQDARVFSLAHERLDALADSIAKALTSGRADDAVLRRENSMVTILSGLVEALSDENQQDPFRDGEQGGEGQDGQGGGGQGGGQGQDPALPPIAELRLLRALQGEALELTRALHEAEDAIDPIELDALVRLQDALVERASELVEQLAPEGIGAEEPGT